MPRLRRENGPEKLRAHWPLRGMCSAIYVSPDRAALPTVVKARHAPYPCPVVAYGVRGREAARTGQTRGKDRHEGTDRGPVRDARRLRLRRRGAGLMTRVKANGVTLGVEHFGDAAAPLILLAGGTTMLSWPDALCEALVRGGRHVVRYDLRDCGASTTVDPKAPAYTLRDLAADAAALARGLDDRPAHLAGIGVGGIVAQIAALDYPDAFSALTLAATRPVAPGRPDDDLPDH